MIVNLTPHAVHLPDRVIEPSGVVARCAEITAPAGEFDGAPLITRRYGEVIGLPEPRAGTLYIVAALVRLALPDRADLASPGDLIRDESGQIIGAANLIVNGRIKCTPSK